MGLANSELYDPVTGTFAAAGSMTVERYGHTATLCQTERCSLPVDRTPASAELYDQTPGHSHNGQHDPGPGRPHGDVVQNGKVLIAVQARLI